MQGTDETPRYDGGMWIRETAGLSCVKKRADAPSAFRRRYICLFYQLANKEKIKAFSNGSVKVS